MSGNFSPRWRWALLALAALLFGVAGCKGSAKLFPAQGKVVWQDGSPATELAGGTILFESVTTEAKEVITAQGEIGPDASFRLTTRRPGDGAPAGAYRVAVIPLIDPEEDKRPKVPLIDEDYTRPLTTTLEAKLEPRPNQDLVIRVPKGKKRRD